MSNEVSVKISKATHAKVKKIADAEGRKIQRVVEDAIQAGLRKLDAQPRS